MEKLGKLNVGPKDSSEMQVSAAEFVLEGLHAHKKIGRNEERVFTAGEKPMKVAEKQPPFERDEPGFGRKRGFN
jgi:magnesium chelatase subunit I